MQLYNISRGHLLRGTGRGGLQLIIQPINFIRVTIYPAAMPHNISRGHYLPCKIYCLALACIKAIIHLCHNVANILENSYAILQIFHNKKCKAIYFFTSQGHFWPLIDKVGLLTSMA